MSQCQRAKDNSTLNPQKPIGALELLSQREGGAAKGAGSLARVMQLQTCFPKQRSSRKSRLLVGCRGCTSRGALD